MAFAEFLRPFIPNLIRSSDGLLGNRHATWLRVEAADVIVSDGRRRVGASTVLGLNQPDERNLLGLGRVAAEGEPQCGADLVHPRGA